MSACWCLLVPGQSAESIPGVSSGYAEASNESPLDESVVDGLVTLDFNATGISGAEGALCSCPADLKSVLGSNPAA